LESQLSNLHKDHSPRWEEEKRNLLIQLNKAQMERGQLRAHLQIADTQDRRDVVELFDKLNISIKNSCLLASKAVLKSAQLNSSWTTKDASDPKQLQKLLDGAGLLVVSSLASQTIEDLPSEISVSDCQISMQRSSVDSLVSFGTVGVDK
jgi:hypothetical protein